MGKITDALKNLGAKINGVTPSGRLITEVLRSMGGTTTGEQINGKTIPEVLNDIADKWPIEPVELVLTVEPVDGSVNEFGKLVSELQSNIALNNDEITGTLNYVTGYTGFSSNVSEQSGHYIALKVTANKAATITGQVINGTHGAVTLDSDGEIVCRIANNQQSIRFVATDGEETVTVEYALTNLVLQPEPQPVVELVPFSIGQSVQTVKFDTTKSVQDVVTILNDLTKDESITLVDGVNSKQTVVYASQKSGYWTISVGTAYDEDVTVFSEEAQDGYTEGWQNLNIDGSINCTLNTVNYINLGNNWNGVLCGNATPVVSGLTPFAEGDKLYGVDIDPNAQSVSDLASWLSQIGNENLMYCNNAPSDLGFGRVFSMSVTDTNGNNHYVLVVGTPNEDAYFTGETFLRGGDNMEFTAGWSISNNGGTVPITEKTSFVLSDLSQYKTITHVSDNLSFINGMSIGASEE